MLHGGRSFENCVVAVQNQMNVSPATAQKVEWLNCLLPFAFTVAPTSSWLLIFQMRHFLHGEGKNKTLTWMPAFGKHELCLSCNDRWLKFRRAILDDQHPRMHLHEWLCDQYTLLKKNYFYFILFSCELSLHSHLEDHKWLLSWKTNSSF